jgi:exopolysaccharide biosynthesis predicted pyruvyltransferase EpsI
MESWMREAQGKAAGGVVQELGGKIDEVLGPLVPAGARCALLDFPNYSNVGDSALWLGETQWLRRRQVEIVYASDIYTFSAEVMAPRLRDGIILLSGGGNLGDFWVDHQRFRERVIESCPRNRIVQLPQSIHFIDDSHVVEAARVFGLHPDFTLLLRDHASLALAKERFNCRSLLCPDTAFALGALTRAAAPDVNILWLARTDEEARPNTLSPAAADVRVVDWVEEPVTPLAAKSSELWDAMFKSGGNAAIVDALMAVYEPLARQRLARGSAMLARGRVVVTDRLHGCILSLLLGIPHVLLDNVYGKLRGFREAFLRDCALTHVADTPAEALPMARALVNAST